MLTINLHEHAGQVPLDEWELRGVRVPVIDIDNTLTDFHGTALIPEVAIGLRDQDIAKRFVGVGLASNGTNQDRVDYVRDMIKDELGVDAYGVCADTHHKKPNPDMGQNIARYFDVETQELGVIGDRWMTDVRFGRRLGVRAISLCHKVGEGDAPGVQFLRVIESGLVLVERALRTAKDNKPLVE